MKRINQTIATLSLGLALTAAATAGDAMKMVDEAAKLDVKKVCDVKANGVAKVLAIAEKYNPAAVELGVEFKRLGIRNSVYIKGLKEAVKAKKPEVTLKYKAKGKEKKKTFKTDYAAWRACTFAVRALQQVKEADKTYRLAIPGDGFKF